MKMKGKLLNRIVAVRQSKWTWSALMTLALVGLLLGVTGCPHHH